MKFSEKLRQQRHAQGLTQEELAARLGVSKRTVEGYEAGKYYPRRRETYYKIAEILGQDAGWYMMEEMETAEQMAQQVLDNASALYSGGTLSEEDKDALAQALMEAYWIAKRKQKKKGENTSGDDRFI